MAKEFKYRCYKKQFQSIPDIMNHMLELQHELRRTDASNIQYFNITYFIITKNVFAKTGTGFFSDDTVMKQLDINFARYYFDALKAYTEEKKTTPAWKIMFDFCKQDNSMPLIYIALGVNAHVNNDLGLSLFDTASPAFKPDFDKVNPVIYQSLHEVLTKNELHQVYKPFMRLLIYHWRKNAWRNFEGLTNKTLTKNVIEKEALKLAIDLARVHSVKDFYHILKVY